MTIVLKVGGSLITDKTGAEVVDHDQLSRVCTILSEHAPANCILVHGGGSFGHHAANAHNVSTTTGTRDPAAIRDVMHAMDRLRGTVVDELQEAGVPAVPVPTRALATKDQDGDVTLAPHVVAQALAEDFIPVLHGDIVIHTQHGATILSGDTLAIALARALDCERIGLCAAVPGVLDAQGEVVPAITSFADVAPLFSETRGTDVSGGMAAKVQALLGVEVPGAIFGIEALASFLNGELPGTQVHPVDTDPF